MIRIRLADSDNDLRRSHRVMRQLRPHLDLAAFLAQVRRQQAAGYRLAIAESDSDCVAVAGFRVGECLAWGRFLYVDDLVTDTARRSEGHGARMLEWLVETARGERCAELHLDSGVQRFAAHRFYLRHGLDITSHHFRVVLPDPSDG